MSTLSPKKMFLIDGSALAYRSYFAFIKNPLITSKGEDTSTVYGFTKALLKVIDDEQPDYLAVVFDTPKPTFRHEKYEAYKATRQKMPDDMAEQLPRLREMIEALNIPIIELPGYEADDVLGTFARRGEIAGLRTFLVSGDKDFMQLVNEHTLLYNLKKGSEDPEITDAARVMEKMGVPPELIIDLFGLMGDTSDNVPGAKGIGPKTALKLIKQFGSLDQLLINYEQIKSERIREIIKENKDLIDLSKFLVTIDTNVPVDFELETLEYQAGDPEKLAALFKELEFVTLIERVTTDEKPFQTDYRTLESVNEVAEYAKVLVEQGEFTFDLETTHIDPLQAELVGFSFCFEAGKAVYIPVRPSQPEDDRLALFSEKESKALDVTAVLKILKPILENPEIKKCGQNIKYDILVLTNYGVEVRGVSFDTMVASYVIDPERRQHNLDSLSLDYLRFKKIPTSDLIGKGKNQISMAEVPIEKVANYACEDADMTQRLKDIFQQKLSENELDELFNQVEMPLVAVLIEMERNGVSIDTSLLKKMALKLEMELAQIMQIIEKFTGTKINLNSPKQLSDLLFNQLKLKPLRKTKTGYSTDVNVLEELAKKHELPKFILEYRQLAKLQSTYVLALPRLINPRTSRIHTSFNQTVAVTGRLSSSSPNLQNIPIRTENGREIRRAFVPGSPEHVFIDADYSQIELRIMAHLSNDATLLESFSSDEDIHRRTAALVFGLAAEDVTPDQRNQAKAINFGIIYGMGDFGLANRLDISQKEARAFIDGYFLKYPGVKKFREDVISEAQKTGYVTTLLGRQRKLPDILSDNRRRREFAERTAVNTPIQGSAADLIKVAMINIHHRLIREKLTHIKMLLQVHDELIFEVPRQKADDAKQLIREEMEAAIQLNVPLKVDIKIGNNWLEAH